MSRALSIAGVQPLGWLARVRAQRSCSARACPAAQLLGAGAAGLAPARATALGMGAMMVRVCARGQANGSADGYLCARAQLMGRQLRAGAHQEG
jgi:hypothetical protein